MKEIILYHSRFRVLIKGLTQVLKNGRRVRRWQCVHGSFDTLSVIFHAGNPYRNQGHPKKKLNYFLVANANTTVPIMPMNMENKRHILTTTSGGKRTICVSSTCTRCILLQVGHFPLNSIHFIKHFSWNFCLQHSVTYHSSSSRHSRQTGHSSILTVQSAQFLSGTFGSRVT
jgi:hypothetical protein